MSKPISKEQAREAFLEHIRQLAFYWSRVDRGTIRERCDGVAFSILALLDGVSGNMPTYDIVVRPDPTDQAYHEENGEDYYVDATVINNDCYLHDLYYKKDEKHE